MQPHFNSIKQNTLFQSTKGVSMKSHPSVSSLTLAPNSQSFVINSETSAPQMNISTHSVPRSLSSQSFSDHHAIFAMALSLALLGLTSTLRAQTISDNFNSGKDIGWTPYEGSPGTREVQFTTNADGNIQYRLINHGSKDESGQFTRGASIRNDAAYSSSFFVATDVATWDDNMIGFAGPFIMARHTPGQIAPGSPDGYLTTHFTGGPNAVQGLIGFIEFQSEALHVTSPDEFSGGTV